jgi:hypothetical protein
VGDGQQDTTLGVLLIRVIGETAQHAGHADIVRELIDDTDDAFWRDRRRTVQQVANHYR